MGVKEQPSSAVGCGANRERRGQTGSRGIRLGGGSVYLEAEEERHGREKTEEQKCLLS